MGSKRLAEIPVIDLSNTDQLSPGSSSRHSTCAQIRNALEEYGCFVAKYEPFSDQLCHQIGTQAKGLFDLPTETKMKNVVDGDFFRGYIRRPSDVLVPSMEGLGIDKATSLPEARKFERLIWPHGNDNFCEIAHSTAKLLADLDQTATKMLFESYGAEEKYDETIGEKNDYLLRFIKYRETLETESDTRFVSHSDKTFTSIILQIDIGGLEIQAKDGSWIGVEPQPCHFLFLAGDAMQGWSNDRIRACKHRVKISAGKGERHSIVLFAINQGIINVPEELVDDKHPLQYKPFDHCEFIRFSTSGVTKFENHLKAYCGV